MVPGYAWPSLAVAAVWCGIKIRLAQKRVVQGSLGEYISTVHNHLLIFLLITFGTIFSAVFKVDFKQSLTKSLGIRLVVQLQLNHGLQELYESTLYFY